MTHPQLRRLKIHRYEQFVDVPWIEFSPDENVILGINGAGKTRLLLLIRAVLNFNYEQLLAQDFDLEFELAYPGSDRPEAALVEMKGRIRSEEGPPDPGARGLESLAPPRQLVIRLDAQTAAHRLVYTSDRMGSSLQFDASTIVVTRTPPAGNVVPWDHLSDTKDLPLLEMWPDFYGSYSREDASEFQSLTTDISFHLRTGHFTRMPSIADTGGLPPLLIATLVNQLAMLKRTERMREGLQFRVKDSFPAFAGEGAPPAPFRPLLESLAAEFITFSPKVVQSNRDVLDCQGFEIRLKFTSGAEYADTGLTFGQRRFLMMAMLLLFRPSYPALIDEIDNGLHPRLVEAALQMLDGRQSFLTSHNKIVIDYVNYDSAEDLRRKIHICRRDADGNQTVDTLSEAVAQEVYEKVAVGIMHPSDVLLMEGLW